MKCNECGHDLAEHRLYGCDAGAEDEAEKARLFDIIEQRTRNGQWTVRASGPDYVGVYLHNTGETIEAPHSPRRSRRGSKDPLFSLLMNKNDIQKQII